MTASTFTIDSLRPVAEAPFQCFFSSAVQVPDLIEWMLKQSGPAEIKITSFSISEEFLRRLFFFSEAKNIKSITLVLDFKATQKTLLLWPFIRQTIKHCYLAENHSKSIIVNGEHASIAAIISQNLTRGNRIESYTVAGQPEVVQSLNDAFDSIVKFNSVPFHDVYDSATADD